MVIDRLFMSSGKYIMGIMTGYKYGSYFVLDRHNAPDVKQANLQQSTESRETCHLSQSYYFVSKLKVFFFL